MFNIKQILFDMKFNIKIAKLPTAVCYDLEHSKHAKTDELIHVLYYAKGDDYSKNLEDEKVKRILQMICNIIGLEGYERNVYQHMIISENTNYKSIVTRLSVNLNVNPITIKRAIISLINKNIIDRKDEEEIIIYDRFKLDFDLLKNKKYIVIDLL